MSGQMKKRPKPRPANPPVAAGVEHTQVPQSAGDASPVPGVVQPPVRGSEYTRAVGTAAAFFIAEAGRKFGASLDLDETLRNIADLVVRWFADWCIVDVLETDGRVARTTAAAADSRDAELVRALLELPLDHARATLIAETDEVWSPIIMGVVTDEHLRASARSDRHLELLRRMNLTSCIAVPLVAGKDVVGGMLIASKRGQLGAFELETATEIAGIAALAVRNARMHSDVRHALDTRDDRLAMVAHDLRSPVSNTVFAAGLLRLRLRESGVEALDSLLDIVCRSAEHMTHLISDLTDVVALESGRLTVHISTIPAAALVTDAIEALSGAAATAGVRLEVEITQDAGNVAADRTRILQVFTNLIGNALKFTQSGGSVRVTERTEADRVRFAVIDSGAGMEPAALQRVFEPFWRGPGHREHGPGLGLGLTIARDIVALHGGTIHVTSAPGIGTEASFSLPRA
jgi:signal transduction histidine kinase